MSRNEPVPLAYGQARHTRGLNLLALASIALPLVSVPIYFVLADRLPIIAHLPVKPAERVAFLVYAVFAAVGVPIGVFARMLESRRPTRWGHWLASIGIALSVVSCFVLGCNYWLNA